MPEQHSAAMPSDYDSNPARYRLGMRVAASYLDPSVTPLHARIWELLPDRSDLVIADVGCADGRLAAARPHGRAGRVVGIDRSAALLTGTRTRQSGPTRALPLADGSVTVVVAVNMLDHLSEPLAAIREARRALAPDGVFVAATVSRRVGCTAHHTARPGRDSGLPHRPLGATGRGGGGNQSLHRAADDY